MCWSGFKHAHLSANVDSLIKIASMSMCVKMILIIGLTLNVVSIASLLQKGIGLLGFCRNLVCFLCSSMSSALPLIVSSLRALNTSESFRNPITGIILLKLTLESSSSGLFMWDARTFWRLDCRFRRIFNVFLNGYTGIITIIDVFNGFRCVLDVLKPFKQYFRQCKMWFFMVIVVFKSVFIQLVILTNILLFYRGLDRIHNMFLYFLSFCSLE